MSEEMKAILVERMQDNLQILRIKLKLSQEQLGDMIGVSRYTIMQMENKSRVMTWSVFLSLLLIFTKNKETDQLLTFFQIYTDELNQMLKLRK